MRGARLLQCLLVLQNRGRQTSAELATALEVSRRTILRDVDAMTEAGLPIIVHQGNQGGIELGFDYRTRMTALTTDEAEALAMMLATPHPALTALGRMTSARRAAGKVIESLPEPVRARIAWTRERFMIDPAPPALDDPRAAALARAIRGCQIAMLRSRSATPQQIEPVALRLTGNVWEVTSRTTPQPIHQDDWGDISISARVFA
jgi:predicted DNA-binding transcriptional regulator YafY